MKTPYIKPNRHVHDSGYRCFEVGYILEMTEDRKVKEKQVLGEYSDHIYQDYMMLVGESKPFSINIDLTTDGYLRFFSHGKTLAWDYESGLSSMGLKVIKEIES